MKRSGVPARSISVSKIQHEEFKSKLNNLHIMKDEKFYTEHFLNTRLVPVMLNQRLKAPPEETYSLHRKMSGAFLLSAKLGAKIDCKSFFDDVIARYHAR